MLVCFCGAWWEVVKQHFFTPSMLPWLVFDLLRLLLVVGLLLSDNDVTSIDESPHVTTDSGMLEEPVCLVIHATAAAA